jgi:hypothetical protein
MRLRHFALVGGLLLLLVVATAACQSGQSNSGKPPEVTLTIDKSNVTHGEQVKVSWDCKRVTHVLLDGPDLHLDLSGFGNPDSKGTALPIPPNSGTYTLTAEGPGGTAKTQVTVTVK